MSLFFFAIYQVQVGSSLAVFVISKSVSGVVFRTVSYHVSLPLLLACSYLDTTLLYFYFTSIMLLYFECTFTWMNSELKLELKSRMLSHRLEMLSLFLRQVWDLKGSKFERSVWVISVFIIHL